MSVASPSTASTLTVITMSDGNAPAGMERSLYLGSAWFPAVVTAGYIIYGLYNWPYNLLTGDFALVLLGVIAMHLAVAMTEMVTVRYMGTETERGDA